MEAWTAEAVILDRRAHGESSAIVDFFTRDHGAMAGWCAAAMRGD